ncbi:oxidoreductase [Saprospiraceae bacterium]|nr:oxidoreductase [Saprospiraceae bacterium]
MFNLSKKVIVVTGGSGFLGKVMIDYIEKAGGLAINADISCTNDLNNNTAHLDISSEDSINNLIEDIKKEHGHIDGWVNNAYPRTKDWGNKFEDVLSDSWKKNVDLHMNGYFMCCQKVLECMKVQKSGSLINMSSIYGMVGPDFSVYDGTSMTMPGAYAAIKGGLINFSRYLASYYGDHNIRVNCISPGGIWDNQPKSFVESYNRKVPLNRMGTPEDIAPAVVFLLSDQASYITGHNLAIDGGWTAI